MEQLIAAGLARMGLDGGKAPLLAEYGALLLKQNQVMNLTAITEPDQVARLHMLDCAGLLGCAHFTDKSLIDVGTGAGFPGLVLKILEPALQLTLLDSLKKRLDWLEQVCGKLGIEGVRFVHARAEQASHDPALREGFDFAAARAVASMSTLSELCLPFVKVGGRFLAMKSAGSAGEVDAAGNAVAELGGRLEKGLDYAIPDTGVRRRVVVVAKLSPTPPRYPRRWAKMQKSPL